MVRGRLSGGLDLRVSADLRAEDRERHGESGSSRGEGHFNPDWKSLESYPAPEWYLDAKFGIFIHWLDAN
jgi:hypothetical protein